jgi:hypothetical protein
MERFAGLTRFGAWLLGGLALGLFSMGMAYKGAMDSQASDHERILRLEADKVEIGRQVEQLQTTVIETQTDVKWIRGRLEKR